ncbi:MAG TPA: hypothetical protein VE131_02115, partial [Terriglobales bacterium]|nr:hypothetical protein [Terriglobales bacterium]
ARVIDEHVDVPKVRHGSREHCLSTCEVGHIVLEADGLASLLLHCRAQGVSRWLIGVVGEGYFDVAGNQFQNNGLTNTTASTRDNGDIPCQ